ncbi:MAG: hypothetical protein ACNI25_10620 [Halarcobacter sp.]
MALSEIDCSKVKNLGDIQGSGTIDQTGENKGIDKGKVACMQKYYLDDKKNKKEANEIKMMISKYYKKYEADENFYKALCNCCQEKVKGFPGIEGSNQWEKLYKCLSNKGYKKS